VSSIDGQVERAYEFHEKFAEAMIGSVAVVYRSRLIGTPEMK